MIILTIKVGVFAHSWNCQPKKQAFVNKELKKYRHNVMPKYLKIVSML